MWSLLFSQCRAYFIMHRPDEKNKLFGWLSCKEYTCIRAPLLCVLFLFFAKRIRCSACAIRRLHTNQKVIFHLNIHKSVCDVRVHGSYCAVYSRFPYTFSELSFVAPAMPLSQPTPYTVCSCFFRPFRIRLQQHLMYRQRPSKIFRCNVR